VTWTEGGTDYFRYEVPAVECPRITKDFWSVNAGALVIGSIGQEYECQFSETRDSVFSYESIQNALSDEVLPLFSDPIDEGTGGT